MIKFLKSRFPFLLFLIPYLIIVIVVYRDFGVAIDEPIEYDFGRLLYNRNFGKDPILMEDFGVEKPNSREIWAYNHFHTMLMYIINDTESIEIYHLLNLLFAVTGLYCTYEYVYQFSRKPILSLIGPLFLFLLPRFMGDVPSNVKDPLFAIWLLVSVLLILLTKKWRFYVLRGILIGTVVGLLVASRFLGYVLIPIYASIRFGLVISSRYFSKKQFFNIVIEILIIALSTILVHSIQMPFIAANPIENLVRLSEIAQSYPWAGSMLYKGMVVAAGQLPWDYVFVWIGITTPLYILLLWLISHSYVKNFYFQVLHVIFWINLLLYFLLKPIIYDGIRHLLFLVVLMALLASLTWVKLWISKPRIRLLLLSTLIFFFVIIVKEYYSLHPYEYVYFNKIAGGLKGASGYYETDYWGLSHKEGALWLSNYLGDENLSKIGICGNWEARTYFSETGHDVEWFPRCESISSETDYILANGRNGDWARINGKELYVVKRKDVPLMKVYRLK